MVACHPFNDARGFEQPPQSVGYDESSGQLYVRFWAGGLYRYLGVPFLTYRALMTSGSLGRYLNWFIKGRYPCQRVN